MSFLHFTKKWYGKLHFGMPFGINLRIVLERIDLEISKSLSFFSTFSYQNQKLNYHFHSYNASYNNERIIEIPIFRYYLKQVSPSQTLEVGNVLSHYQQVKHTIVDKYEEFPQVINQDVVSFKPKQQFSLIVSISTLEHVGQDESTHNPQKAINAIHHLQKLLKPNGKCVISVPIGHNKVLDSFISQYSQEFPKKVTYFERISESNRWKQTSPNRANKHTYGSPYPCANALAIAIFPSFNKA